MPAPGVLETPVVRQAKDEFNDGKPPSQHLNTGGMREWFSKTAAKPDAWAGGVRRLSGLLGAERQIVSVTNQGYVKVESIHKKLRGNEFIIKRNTEGLAFEKIYNVLKKGGRLGSFVDSVDDVCFEEKTVETVRVSKSIHLYDKKGKKRAR